MKKVISHKKLILFLSVIVFIVSLVPILYLAPFDFATGDDYGYSADTHAIWLQTHSLLELLKTAMAEIYDFYYTWQGTWFSTILFAIQPEIFGFGYYFVVPIFTIALLIVTTYFFAKRFLQKICAMDKCTYLTILLVTLFVLIQFVPSTRSGIYWYNGVAHYMIPLFMTLIGIVLADKIMSEAKGLRRIAYLIILTILQLCVGGSNYQAALLLPLTIMIDLGMRFLDVGKGDSSSTKKKFFARNMLFCIPFIFEMNSLIFSIKAPGNKVRGGESFGFNFQNIIWAFYDGFHDMIVDFATYLTDKTVMFAAFIFILMAVISFFEDKMEMKDSKVFGYEKFRHPIVFLVLLFLLNLAMHIPASFSRVDVSGGVGNTNFQVFVFSFVAYEVYFCGYIFNKIYLNKDFKQNLDADDIINRNYDNKKSASERPTVLKSDEQDGLHNSATLAYGIMFFCMMILVVVGRHSIKNTTFYVCCDYILSGQADDYKEQMILQNELLSTDESDVVLPMINDYQGPLMHMPVTDDENAFTNDATARFYGKSSVIGIDRNTWYEIYE